MTILLSKNSSIVGFSLSKSSSSLARLISFCSSSKNSSLARSSLIVCPCRPMDIIGANWYSLPMTYSTSCVPTTAVQQQQQQLPWLMLAPESNAYKFYSLWEKDVKEVAVESTSDPPPDAESRCFGQSVQGWMGYIRHKDCRVFLYNPLSGKKINLPPVETIPSVERVIRNSQSGLVESIISDLSCKPLTPQSCSYGLISDVVLSSSPMDDNCIAVVSYGCHDKLAFCRRSTRPNCWIPLHSPLKQFNQIVYHSGKKLFYTLSRGLTYELEAWDLHSDPIKRFHIEDQSQVLKRLYQWPPCDFKDKDLLDKYDSIDWVRTNHLVYDHQSQELFIVMRHTLDTLNVIYKHRVPHIEDPDLITHKTITFDVFKVDFINDHLVKVQNLKDSIGNRAFFIGKKRGFVLSTTKFPELRPGSIYFADEEYQWQYNFGGHDMGIYDYEEDSIIDKIESISPAHSWFIPDVDSPDIDADF